ncbi:C2 domain-containing protein 5-like [Symsagittifera roscoffensis]|uniref:C2 domain-containing protein 5-like n=1 Tax=Symsagittifera roscoffensis TaxID=84072 RepID=UPI00307C445D
MPGELRVNIKSARGLPIMDRRSELTDAFVEIRFAGEVKKTPVCHRSLSPTWGDPETGVGFCFNFSEDEQLFEELLLLRVMDHDTYSAHDAIGRVDIDLSMFLYRSSSPNQIAGFFPIFDTMHGIRGELYVKIEVSLIPTTNSTTDVVFYASASVPPNCKLVTVFGLVDELVVNEDPEFQLIDKLRTSRTSNEVRVKVFSQLSAQVRRKLALKSLDLGANAVLGYQQFFDIEGDTGVVVRGFGTAVKRVQEVAGPKGADQIANLSSSQQTQSGLTHSMYSGSNLNPVLPHQMSIPGVSPDPNAVSSLEDCMQNQFDSRIYKHVVEYPFFTLLTFEHGGHNSASNPYSFITSIGGLVCARSVKLLDRMEDPEKSLMRDNWWLELRIEIKSHMEAFSCNCVVGYSEYTTMYEDLMVLSAMGTAANLDPAFSPKRSNLLAFSSMSIDHPESSEQLSPRSPVQNSGGGTSPGDSSSNPFAFQNAAAQQSQKCSLLHLPYNDASLPFASDVPVCAMCKAAKVHDVLLSTCEPPADIVTCGPPVILHANVVKKKRRGHGETEAVELSGMLSFIEHEVQQQLLHKMQMCNMNSCWSVRITLTVTENAVIGLAVGTGLHLAALPFPHLVNLPSKFQSGNDGGLRNEILNSRNEIINSSQVEFIAGDGKDAIEALQESLPNIDLSLDGKQVQASVIKTLDEPILNHLYKSALKAMNARSSTLGVSTVQEASGNIPGVQSSGQNRVFNNLAIQVSHCDSYRNTAWNSNAFSQTLDSVLAKLNFKSRRKNLKNVLINVRMNLSGSDNMDDSAMLCCTADICEPIATDLDSLILSRSPIQISSLASLPNYRVEKYMGYINTFFIRETTDLRQFGSTQGFVSCCLTEILTVLSARIANMSANALLNFSILYFDVYDNMHKNQAQALLNVRGDIVKLTWSSAPPRSNSD